MNTNQKSMSLIPYEKIDTELVDVIKLLNEKGLITRSCCYGHNKTDKVIIQFNKDVNDELIYDLMLKLKNNEYVCNKWVRYLNCYEDIWCNWILTYPNARTIYKPHELNQLKKELTINIIQILNGFKVV